MKPQRSEVFTKTCEGYLHQIQQMDFLAKADMLGLERKNDCLIIPVYNTKYLFSRMGIEKREGEELSVPLQVILYKYLIICSLDVKPVVNKLLPFRDFKDAAPLVSHFTNNTSRLLETTFAGRLDELKCRCCEIGGVVQDSDVYDLSCRFYALPRIPVILNYNDRDEMFPASCSILFQSSAARYLDMECLSMTGTLLSGLLTRKTVA